MNKKNLNLKLKLKKLKTGQSSNEYTSKGTKERINKIIESLQTYWALKWSWRKVVGIWKGIRKWAWLINFSIYIKFMLIQNLMTAYYISPIPDPVKCFLCIILLNFYRKSVEKLR